MKYTIKDFADKGIELLAFHYVLRAIGAGTVMVLFAADADLAPRRFLVFTTTGTFPDEVLAASSAIKSAVGNQMLVLWDFFLHNLRYLGVNETVKQILSNELLQQSQFVEEDERNGDRSDVTNQEIEGVEEIETDGSLIGHLFQKILAFDKAPDEDADEHSAGGQQYFGRDEVQQIEEVESADRISGEKSHGQRTEDAQNDTDARNDPGAFLARHFVFLFHVRRRYFVHRDSGNECGERQKNEEDARPNIAQRQTFEDIRQGDEDKLRTGFGTDAERKGCGKYHDAGQYSDDRIDDGHLKRCVLKIRLGGEIGGIGDHRAHSDAEREEGLSHGAEKRRRGDLREIRMEQEVQSAACAFQRDGTDAECDEDNEKHRHHHFGGAFDAFLHAGSSDEMRQQNEYDRPDERADEAG